MLSSMSSATNGDWKNRNKMALVPSALDSGDEGALDAEPLELLDTERNGFSGLPAKVMSLKLAWQLDKQAWKLEMTAWQKELKSLKSQQRGHLSLQRKRSSRRKNTHRNTYTVDPQLERLNTTIEFYQFLLNEAKDRTKKDKRLGLQKNLLEKQKKKFQAGKSDGKSSWPIMIKTFGLSPISYAIFRCYKKAALDVSKNTDFIANKVVQKQFSDFMIFRSVEESLFGGSRKFPGLRLLKSASKVEAFKAVLYTYSMETSLYHQTNRILVETLEDSGASIKTATGLTRKQLDLFTAVSPYISLLQRAVMWRRSTMGKAENNPFPDDGLYRGYSVPKGFVDRERSDLVNGVVKKQAMGFNSWTSDLETAIEFAFKGIKTQGDVSTMIPVLLSISDTESMRSAGKGAWPAALTNDEMSAHATEQEYLFLPGQRFNLVQDDDMDVDRLIEGKTIKFNLRMFTVQPKKNQGLQQGLIGEGKKQKSTRRDTYMAKLMKPQRRALEDAWIDAHRNGPSPYKIPVPSVYKSTWEFGSTAIATRRSPVR